MSFVKINPGGFALGDKLASAQMNQLDADHANALDKSLAGDTFVGPLSMASTASIQINNPGASIIAQVVDAIYALSPGGVRAHAPGAITSAVSVGIKPGVAGGISGGGVAGGIVSGGDGGIQLTGSSVDNVTFSSTRSRHLSSTIMALNGDMQSGWNTQTGSGLPGLSGTGSVNSQPIALPRLHDGARLVAVTIYFAVGVSHANVPAVLPALSVRGANVSAATSLVSFNLRASDPVHFPTPASGAAWFASGTLQSLTYTCNQNNAPVNSQDFTYWALLTDENGANSASGNSYYFLQLSYDTIVDTRFQ